MSEERAEYETSPTPADVPEATFESLLEQYRQEEGEFEYTIEANGVAMKFRARRLVNLQEKIELTERGEKFLTFVNGKNVPEGWKPFLTKKPGRKVAMMIVYASTLLVSPKLSQFQCLQLAATAGDALIEIAGPLLGVTEESVAVHEDAEITDLKND